MAAYLLLFCCILVPIVYRLYHVGKRPADFPPGPPTLPVLGNLHQLAGSMREPHLQFQKWAQEHGPIFSLMLGTKTMIVLSKDTVIKDLIDKKSAIYSSRPDFHIGKMMSGGFRMVMESPGPRWRMQRKLVHTALSAKKVEAYEPYQDIETRQLLFDILHDPDSLLDHLRRYASSTVTSVLYGFRWNTFDDHKLQEFFHMIEEMQDMSSKGLTLLPDVFPILRKIPTLLYPMSGRAQRHHNHEKIVYTDYYRHVKHAFNNNLSGARACTCQDILSAQVKHDFSDNFGAYIAGTLLEAGSETTSGSLYGFAQAILLYPRAQTNAHEEVDRVCGDTLPTFADMSRLPYVRACVKETLRWMTTAPLGTVPHALSQDDSYMGYRLPAGAMVLLNVFSIHRDSARYSEPAKFLPERFLNDDTTAAESFAKPDVEMRDHFSFGSGRRVCPGMHLAERSLLLAIARLLWAFEFKPKVGADGKEVLPVQDKYIAGVAVRPERFEVSVVPRRGREGLVGKLWDEGRERLDAQGNWIGDPISGAGVVS